jgi:hypothetical protein
VVAIGGEAEGMGEPSKVARGGELRTNKDPSSPIRTAIVCVYISVVLDGEVVRAVQVERWVMSASEHEAVMASSAPP